MSSPQESGSDENEDATQFAGDREHHGTSDAPGWDVKSADSYIGGQPVEGDEQRRIFNFSLPFSAPFASPFSSAKNGLRQLGAVLAMPLAYPLKSRAIPIDPPEALAVDIESDEEHEAYALGKLNPRSHALKSSLKPSIMPTKVPNIKGNVVILGGYRGSILRDAKTHRTVWIPFRVGFKLRKINLEIGPSDQDEYDAEKHIVPDGILDHVGPVDVCRRLINQLRAQPDCTVTEFGYDWRQSLDISSEKLYKLLEDLQAKSPRGDGAIVIAHSMGGLIAHHTVQRCARANKNLVRGIVYAGSPSECQPILGPLRKGEPVMFAKDILTPKANFLMRSSFCFLPRNGRCFIDKNDVTKEYKLDFYDVKTWIDYELSPCVAKDPQVRAQQNGLEGESDTPMLDYDVAVEYLDRTLKRTKKFHEDLERIPGTHYPPMAVVYGNTLPACRGAIVSNEDEIRTCQFEDLWYSAGDGVVSRRTLVPLQYGFPEVPTFASRQGHIGLLSDLDVMASALQAVLNEDDENTESESEESTLSSITSRLVSRTRFSRTMSMTRSRSPAPDTVTQEEKLRSPGIRPAWTRSRSESPGVGPKPPSSPGTRSRASTLISKSFGQSRTKSHGAEMTPPVSSFAHLSVDENAVAP